jgi:uncharacterized protein
MNILNDFFNADTLSEETMYFMEMHGFLTSLVIQPGSFSADDILSNILGDTEADNSIAEAIAALQKDIEQSLLNGEFPDTSIDNDDEDSLTLWASGFMQGVFAQEDSWFKTHPEEVAELTLPILSCSELLDDEDGDMGDINQRDEMFDDMAEKIPDCVIDLYLLFNTPDGA